MISLLMIADDFTGALDTGVQFAASGIATRVVVGTDIELVAKADEAQVLVVDAETRHLAPERTFQAVKGLTRQAEEALAGFEHSGFHIWLARQLAQRRS